MFFKIGLLLSLSIIFLQDNKDRKVYWFLFPMTAICSGVLLYSKLTPILFYTTIIVNISVVIFLLIVVFLYARFKLKVPAHTTFGLGDALLFLALTFTFTSLSFIILFVFGLLFSLLIHLVVKRKSNHTTVPLAGYLSLFFIIIYITNWFGGLKNIYLF